SVSLCRHLGRRGIPIKVSGNPVTCMGMYSRYCQQRLPVPAGTDQQAFWRDLLLSEEAPLRGHVVFPCNDEAVEFLAHNQAALKERYLLPEYDPELQLALLDKKRTLELARFVGVPTPQFWTIESVEDVKKIRDEVMFPVMVK